MIPSCAVSRTRILFASPEAVHVPEMSESAGSILRVRQLGFGKNLNLKTAQIKKKENKK